MPILLLLLLLTGCAKENISVRSDYLSRENLASFIVGTPDPRLNCPNVGQRLVISWDLPQSYLCMDDLHFKVDILFRSGGSDHFELTINKYRSHYTYLLLNDDYFEKNGILTYKVDLYGDGEWIDGWRHQLWSERIEFPQ